MRHTEQYIVLHGHSNKQVKGLFCNTKAGVRHVVVMIKVRVSLQGINISRCNVPLSDDNKIVCLYVSGLSWYPGIQEEMCRHQLM